MSTEIMAGVDGAQGTARPTSSDRPPLRLAAPVTKARSAMTIRELMDAQRDDQAAIHLEAEVRKLAMAQGLSRAEANLVANRSRAGFRFVNGEPVPVAADRQSVVLAADGINVMSVTEWVRRNAKLQMQNEEGGGQARGTDGKFLAQEDDEVLPLRNPFRRKTWNVTEQMRLQRRDPKLARRLKAEAYADGDIKHQ